MVKKTANTEMKSSEKATRAKRFQLASSSKFLAVAALKKPRQATKEAANESATKKVPQFSGQQMFS